MSFLDLAVNSSFKSNERGQTVFLPWGKLGKGYVLGSEQKAAEARRFVKRTALSVFGLLFLTIFTVGPTFAIFWFPFWSLFYWWRVNRMLRACETIS
jgi:hypothetical protein